MVCRWRKVGLNLSLCLSNIQSGILDMKHLFSRITFAATGITFLAVAYFSLTSFTGEDKRMKLVWADEFSTDGLPDSTKWGYDIGNGCPVNCGWGNNELQYYTSNRQQNARVKEGHLIIEARREKMGDMEYSSARLVSKKKGDWTYGRIDVRAKLPVGTGVWPAIWMLPTDWVYGGWPGSGEIDIMEHVGYIPDSIFGTVHTNLFNGMLGTQKSKGIASKTVAGFASMVSSGMQIKLISFLMTRSILLFKTGMKALMLGRLTLISTSCSILQLVVTGAVKWAWIRRSGRSRWS
jgi:hypothetical protein